MAGSCEPPILPGAAGVADYRSMRLSTAAREAPLTHERAAVGKPTASRFCLASASAMQTGGLQRSFQRVLLHVELRGPSFGHMASHLMRAADQLVFRVAGH